jgi:hypothetical protein
VETIPGSRPPSSIARSVPACSRSWKSDRPVYGLTFLLGCGEDETPEYYSKPQEVKHLMPHATAVFKPEEHEHSILWGTSWEPEEVWCAVHFRDAAGETWQVNSKGQLERAPAIPD